MLIFSCAAPLGALCTYALLALDLFEAKEVRWGRMES
jgi:hypothetical protein